MKARVPKHQNPREFVLVETAATIGATLGVNVFNQDGTLYVPPGSATPAAPGVSVSIWRYLLEIPPNVTALASTATTGLYAVTGAGTSATRMIEGVVGRTTVSNGGGVAGNPVVDLAVRPNTDIGAALVRITRDAFGRVEGTQAATTADLTEGANLYYTAARADARIDLGIAAHVAAADPHPQYLTPAEGAAAYAPLAHVGDGGAQHANAIAAGAAGFMTGADKTKLDGVAPWTSGNGTPEGALVAAVGSMYTRLDGGAGTTLYVKETGTGSTGWIGK